MDHSCSGAPGQELPSWGYRGHEEAERCLPEADQGGGHDWAGAACGQIGCWPGGGGGEAAQSHFSEDSKVSVFNRYTPVVPVVASVAEPHFFKAPKKHKKAQFMSSIKFLHIDPQNK